MMRLETRGKKRKAGAELELEHADCAVSNIGNSDLRRQSGSSSIGKEDQRTPRASSLPVAFFVSKPPKKSHNFG